jgi:uncharacterized iron-regulated membrane protein
MEKVPINKLAAQTRWYRKIHRSIGIVAAFVLLLVSITGLLLAWKKNSGGLLLANTQTGTHTQASGWLPIAALQSAAVAHLKAHHPDADTTIDRMEIRPEKGVMKVSFKHHYNGIQLDLATARLLLLEQRRSDFIEHLHDGSIIDKWMGGDGGKLLYSTIGGLSLFTLVISGFFLWANPNRIRKLKQAKLHSN